MTTPPDAATLPQSSPSACALPAGYHSVTPYLIVQASCEAIAFYGRAFGAVEVMRLDGPHGKVWHAEIQIGNSPLMLADEFPDMGYRSPQSLGGSPVSILLYVENVDTLFSQAIAAGAKETMAVADQFDGDRRDTLTDPFGHVWLLATKKEDVSPEEMQKRFETMMKQGEA